MRSFKLSSGVLGLLVAARIASAQCPLEWSSELSAGSAEIVTDVQEWDGGRGGAPALYICGAFSHAGGIPATNVARWDGKSWMPLGAGLPGLVRELAVFDDGSGAALYAGGDFRGGLARFDGSDWSLAGGGLNGPVYGLTVHDDGSGPQLFVGGDFSSAGSLSVCGLARWNGSAWSDVGGSLGCGEWCGSFAVHDDGSGPELYVAGGFYTAGGMPARSIARWDGQTWSALGSGLGGTYAVAYALASYDDGSGPRLYVGGYFDTAGGVVTGRLAIWNGSSWSAPGTGIASQYVLDLQTFDDGTGEQLYVGGFFDSAGGQPVSSIARWNGSQWSSVGTGMTGGAFGSPPIVYAFRIHQEQDGSCSLVTGGSFHSVGGKFVNGLASWRDGEWSPVGPQQQGMDAEVAALELVSIGGEPQLFAGGRFGVAGAAQALHVARWDGAQWLPLGAGTDGDVLALAAFDDGTGPQLYAGGSFHQAGGVHATAIARWDGAAWSSVGAGLGIRFGSVRALAVFDGGAGPELYAGGSFTLIGGGGLARWNGSEWSPVPGSLPVLGGYGVVHALRVHDDGHGPSLFVGGDFDIDTGAARASHVARWDGTKWWPLDIGLDSIVRALDVFAGELYAAGDFLHAGGWPAACIARWDGTTWWPLGTGLAGFSAAGLTLCEFHDEVSRALYVGGSFASAGGVPAGNLARWDGASWSAPGRGADASIYALAAVPPGPGGSALFAGGAFESIGSVGASYIARLADPCSCLPGLYCDAKPNSQGCVPQIDWSGSPSASAPEPFHIQGTQIINQKHGLLVYGLAGPATVPFQGGTLCVAGPLRRTPLLASGGNPPPDDCSGSFSLEFNTWIQSGGDPGLIAGAEVCAQYWYRDPASASGTGLTDAMSFVICR